MVALKTMSYSIYAVSWLTVVLAFATYICNKRGEQSLLLQLN